MSTAATQQDAAARLDAVRARIVVAAREAGRDPATVTLIAISKQQPDERIAAALAAGQRVFGENRVQEAEAHWSARRAALPDLDLHMVGPLQTNKVREAVALFDAIHSVDRPRLAAALANETARSGRRPACFIEVNTGEEPQKAGVLPADADAFIERCRTEFALPLAGLMCIPPHDAVPAPHFALLATIARRHGLQSLSMGMSADYEVAVTLGATHVRVGTAIFGERAPR
ncbi:MAG: YggS family pyridoxal phosphate-dependent enzyme [Alphaproteobacteria bacterium]|nr:YggS family pyridoxal phosphate-dependent enzyme [Alphaproteobacteria bacterium]